MSRACVQVLNPATGEPFIEMLSCSTKETEQAIEKAAEAFKTWRKRTADERAQFLLKWKQVRFPHCLRKSQCCLRRSVARCAAHIYVRAASSCWLLHVALFHGIASSSWWAADRCDKSARVCRRSKRTRRTLRRS